MEKHSWKLPLSVMMFNAVVTAVHFVVLCARDDGDSELIKAFAIADTLSAVIPMLVGGTLLWRRAGSSVIGRSLVFVACGAFLHGQIHLILRGLSGGSATMGVISIYIATGALWMTWALGRSKGPWQVPG